MRRDAFVSLFTVSALKLTQVIQEVVQPTPGTARRPGPTRCFGPIHIGLSPASKLLASFPMATLYVRDMPDDLYARLRDEARGSRRSIGAAAIEILQGELRERSELTMDDLLTRARKVRARAVRPAAVSVADEIRADRER